MMTYRTGSKDDPKSGHGAAHFLEHMMFKSTRRYNRSSGNPLPQVLQETGAQINAFTSRDGTYYHEVLPSDKLETALLIERERMEGALLKREEVEKERQVILNELASHESSPYVLLDQAVWKRAFSRHAYRAPVIGYRQELARITARRLRSFYKSHYRPDRAVLCVIGDIETEHALAMIQKIFGDMRSSSRLSPHLNPPPALRGEERRGGNRIRLKGRDEVNLVMIAHKIPSALAPDSPALDVLAGILSGGQTSRLSRKFVDQGLAAGVNSENNKMAQEGLFSTLVMMTPLSSHEAVEQAVFAAYEEIRKEGVTEEEVTKAQNQLLAETAFARDGTFETAARLGEAVALGDWKYFADYPEKVRSVRGSDVQAAAQKYLEASQAVSGFYISSKIRTQTRKDVLNMLRLLRRPFGLLAMTIKESSGFFLSPLRPLLPSSLRAPQGRSNLRDLTNQKVSVYGEFEANPPPPPSAAIPPPAGKRFKDRIQTREIQGIQVMGVRTGVEEVATLAGSFEGAGAGYSGNPILAQLVGQMLVEQTQGWKKFEIASLLENLGAEVSYEVDEERVRFRIRSRSKDLGFVAALVSDQLRFPAFDPKDFQEVKHRLEASLREEVTQTDRQALQKLNEFVFPKGHLYREPSLKKKLKALRGTRIKEARDFHGIHYGPRGMKLVIVGNFDWEEMCELIANKFGDWPFSPLDRPFQEQVVLGGEPQRESIQVSGKVNHDVLWGHALPLTVNHPDFLPAFAANHILGGNFSARLSQRIREEKGLSYGIYSTLSGLTQRVQGKWMIHMIVNGSALEEALTAVRKELEVFVSAGVTDQELRRTRATLTGNFKVAFDTTGGLAEKILQNAEWERDIDYLDQFPERIQNIQLSEVHRVVSAYFNPLLLHTVIAGGLKTRTDLSVITPNPLWSTDDRKRTAAKNL